jgi:hypothetical protein
MDRTPLRQYLVERYVPDVNEQGLRDMSDGLARAANDASASGSLVRYLGSTLIRTEESCFSWFEGPSEDAVRQVLEAAAVPYARILATVALLPLKQGSSSEGV